MNAPSPFNQREASGISERSAPVSASIQRERNYSGSCCGNMEMLSDKTVRVDSSQIEPYGPDGERIILHVHRFPSDDEAILEDFHEFIKPGENSLATR